MTTTAAYMWEWSIEASYKGDRYEPEWIGSFYGVRSFVRAVRNLREQRKRFGPDWRLRLRLRRIK